MHFHACRSGLSYSSCCCRYSTGYDFLGPELDGVVPGAVRAYFDSSDNATLGESQISQVSDKPYCVNFNYSVSTTEKE